MASRGVLSRGAALVKPPARAAAAGCTGASSKRRCGWAVGSTAAAAFATRCDAVATRVRVCAAPGRAERRGGAAPVAARARRDVCGGAERAAARHCERARRGMQRSRARAEHRRVLRGDQEEEGARPFWFESRFSATLVGSKGTNKGTYAGRRVRPSQAGIRGKDTHSCLGDACASFL